MIRCRVAGAPVRKLARCRGSCRVDRHAFLDGDFPGGNFLGRRGHTRLTTRAAKMPLGPHHQHRTTHDEGDRQFQLAPDIGDESAGEVLDDAHRKAAKDGTSGTGRPRARRRRSRRAGRPASCSRSRNTDGRDQHAGDGADRGRHAQRARSSSDPDATRTGRFRVGGGGAHRQSQPGAAEER